MKFDSPFAFWLAILIPAALFSSYWLKSKKKSLFTLSPELLRDIKKLQRSNFLIFLSFLLLLAGLALLLAAEPFYEEASVERKKPGIDIVLAWDLSESMEADDYPPNRLAVSRKVIHDFIRKRSSDRIGLVIFAGEAITKCPLTQDYQFLHRQVDDARLRELKQGTAIGMALSTAVLRLRHSKAKSRVVILLTDGDSNVGSVNPMTAAFLAEEEGIKIYAIGIGKVDRVIVPIYAYDSKGNRGALLAQVPSYLNPELLEKIANTTGGKSYMARDTEALSRVLGEIDKLERSSTESSISFSKRYPVQSLGVLVLFGFLVLFGVLSRIYWWRWYGTTV